MSYNLRSRRNAKDKEPYRDLHNEVKEKLSDLENENARYPNLEDEQHNLSSDSTYQAPSSNTESSSEETSDAKEYRTKEEFSSTENNEKSTTQSDEEERSTADDNTKSSTRKKEMGWACILILWTCLVVFFLLMLKLGLNQKTEKAEKTNDDIQLKHFLNALPRLRAHFPSQSERLWRTIQARSTKHLDSRTPTGRPLVLMIVAQPSTSVAASCFAKKLADIHSLRGHKLFNGKDFESLSGADAKLKLDEELRQTLEEVDAKAIVVDYVELLPPKSPFLFYSYCDQYDSPYESAVIIFVAHLKQELKGGFSFLDAEAAVEDFLLNDMWSEPPYDKDAVAALLSRITDTVLVVDEEPTLNCT